MEDYFMQQSGDFDETHDPHSYYSWVWKTTSNADPIATEDVENFTSRSVCQQLGSSDH